MAKNPTQSVVCPWNPAHLGSGLPQRAHIAATLAQVTRYVFKHNGSVIDTRAQVRPHTHTPRLAQVRRYVFKHLTAI